MSTHSTLVVLTLIVLFQHFQTFFPHIYIELKKNIFPNEKLEINLFFNQDVLKLHGVELVSTWIKQKK